MYATLIVQATSSLDENRQIEISAGLSIRDIISSYGADVGYTRDMVAAVNNVQITDYSTIVSEGDVLSFRVGTKERG